MVTSAVPRPAQEPDRLRDLRELGLGGEPEPLAIDGIPSLAAEVCDRPWAGVSVVQEDQHWFLAVQGPFSSPSPREIAPCSHAINDVDEVFEVEDLTQQAAFEENPLVQEEGVRFYAGAPIESARGHGLGTVCVLDDEPGRLEPGEREALEILSDVVSFHLRLDHRTEKLERANEELDRFTTFVSHELTDPLSQIVSNLDLLSMDLVDEDADEEVQELCQEALAGARRMDRLVKDLLRYGRASDRNLNLEPVDLAEIAEAVRADVATRLEDPTSEVPFGELPQVRADPGLVRRVLDNLVRNALEHGAPPVRVWGEDAGEAWRIWVEDRGPGLSPHEEEHLFELFETGDTASAESTGVGLALCERIVERHGGEIGVASSPGTGARFWFTLPKASVRASS